MATLGEMRARISDELSRDDLANQISLAITQSIQYYQNDTFFQADKISTAATVAAQEEYTYPADVAWFRAVYMTAYGTRIPMTVQTREYILAEQSNATSPIQGTPIEYSVFGAKIQLYPIPDSAAYTITYDYVSKITTPALDTDVGFWVNEGEAMVRNRSKAILYSEVLGNEDKANAAFARAYDEFEQLREQTVLLKWRGRITASQL